MLMWTVFRCTCLQWHSVSLGSLIVRRAANEAISVINRLTQIRSKQCVRLSAGDITAATRYVAGAELLRFRQSSDIHGRTADLSDDMKPTIVSNAKNSGRWMTRVNSLSLHFCIYFSYCVSICPSTCIGEKNVFISFMLSRTVIHIWN